MGGGDEPLQVLTMITTRLVPLLFSLFAAFLFFRVMRFLLQREASELAASVKGSALTGKVESAVESSSRFSRWLAEAGYHSAKAPLRFIMASAASGLLGLAAAEVVILSPVPAGIAFMAAQWPWIGSFLVLMAQLAPFIAFILPASIPMLIVRAARRRRVEEAEKDLPLFLDLFAALAEAGLGFDSALQRILASHPARRALSLEFARYQGEMQAGVSRADGLRRLACRLNIMPLNLFVSAIVQAENTGASIADTLRNQASDGRERRKIRVLLHANALPVKLSFPLIICFLPGILIPTLGPALHNLLQALNGILGRIQ